MIDAHVHPHPAAGSRGDEVAHAELHIGGGDAGRAAVDALRATGERLTEPRLAVLAVLAAHVEHLSADQIAALLESGPRSVHRATVYRTLDRLAEVGVAATMTVAGGPVLYHLAATTDGHAHLHARCRTCGAVSVLPLAAMEEAERIAAAHGFRLEPSRSTLVGECDACTSSPDS